MKKILAISFVVILFAGVAFASNTGFKLNYSLRWVAGLSNTNFVSLPYFYYPDGNVNNPNPQKSSDICRDIVESNGGTFSPPIPNGYVAAISNFNVLGNTMATNSNCATFGGDFDIVPGESYAITPMMDNLPFDIVGSHDDGYDSGGKTVDLRWTGGFANTNWVSVPYHTMAVKSSDLCREVVEQNGGTFAPPIPNGYVAAISRFDVLTNTLSTNTNCATFGGDFDVTPGEGVAITPMMDVLPWNPEHY